MLDIMFGGTGIISSGRPVTIHHLPDNSSIQGRVCVVCLISGIIKNFIIYMYPFGPAAKPSTDMCMNETNFLIGICFCECKHNDRIHSLRCAGTTISGVDCDREQQLPYYLLINSKVKTQRSLVFLLSNFAFWI